MSNTIEYRILLEAVVIEAVAIAAAFALFNGFNAAAWALLTVPAAVWIAGRAVMSGLEPAVPFCLLTGVLVGVEALVGSTIAIWLVYGFSTDWGGVHAIVVLLRTGVAAFFTLTALPALLGFLFSRLALLKE